MKKIISILFSFVLLLTLSLSCSLKRKNVAADKEVKKTETKNEAKTKHEATHWGYSGLMGPSHWGDLDKSFLTCKEGQSQSPINLVWEKPLVKRSIFISYADLPIRSINNGHTIQYNFKPGNFVEIDEKTYILVQLHFHSPSEHTVSSKYSPMEMHLVHKNVDGSIAVLAVMFKIGQHNPTIAKLWGHVPSEIGKEFSIDTVTFDPKSLIPKSKTHYKYHGSLTTPPCTEGVVWNVFNTPVEMSEAQLKAFNTFYAKNNRPVQPMNKRKTINY